MSDQYRAREAAKQQVRPPSRQAPPPGGPPPPLPSGSSQPTSRRAWLFGALAAVAAVAVGGTVLATRENPAAAGGQFEFTVTSDPQQVLDYLHHQTNLPPATQQRLEQQAQRQELVVWHVTQRPGWNNQQAQTYGMDNGLDRYQWTVRTEGLDFGVFAEKATSSFSFSADSNPGNTKMVGTWSTPAGRTRFDMQPGQSIMVPVK